MAALCAAAPLLTWVTRTGHAGHCGWTCYRPSTSSAPRVVAIDGTDGVHVALDLGLLLFAVALLCVAAALSGLRAAGPPAPLGWLLAAVGVGTLVWIVIVIVRYAEGGTLLQTAGRPPFSANLGAGAVVALVGAAGTVLLGAGIAVQAPRSSREPAAVAGA